MALEPNFNCAIVQMFASLILLGLLSCFTNELTVALRGQTQHRCPAHFLGFHSLRVLTLSFQVPASCSTQHFDFDFYSGSPWRLPKASSAAVHAGFCSASQPLSQLLLLIEKMLWGKKKTLPRVFLLSGNSVPQVMVASGALMFSYLKRIIAIFSNEFALVSFAVIKCIWQKQVKGRRICVGLKMEREDCLSWQVRPGGRSLRHLGTLHLHRAMSSAARLFFSFFFNPWLYLSPWNGAFYTSSGSFRLSHPF